MNTPAKRASLNSRVGTPVLSDGTPSKCVLPDRTRIVPSKAQPYKSSIEFDKQKRAKREEGYKRKAEAESRPNSQAPGPIDGTPSKRRKAGPSIDESILSKRFKELTNDRNRTKWYQAANRRREGKDVDITGLHLVELKEMYDNPEANSRTNAGDDPTMTTLPEKQGYPPTLGQSTRAQSQHKTDKNIDKGKYKAVLQEQDTSYTQQSSKGATAQPHKYPLPSRPSQTTPSTRTSKTTQTRAPPHPGPNNASPTK
ncbi:hypothetical protein FRC11_009192, partial [Ceratobasidium sp. 423]